ncbi:tetratricopeptide repeat protein 19 homolog, mitochondrial-like isoform X2 [Episyrphus balteatus]|uniref:tetratricopeptide repeat protein 19 homolog, mitochondrial-like isoform X2 n=1 Tax=Episyrphus balteatus TaxID=286459 RepID=UPI002485C69D|nr:tetratricopeptide repeat protein 19 homolog, mitochondrial-like isoform X2 [Episyrphus balteatus]
MNFTTFSRFSRFFLQNFKNQSTKQYQKNTNTSTKCIRRIVINHRNHSHSFSSTTSIPPIGIILGFSFFSKKDDEETPEDKLIMTIKRSILAIQRKEYDKAEQMLHLALRMAQDLQHKDGITYVYDVLANLAMERGQFKNAEKLFADVMRRLFANGESEDSLKENFEKATQGFNWALDKLKKLPDSEDLNEIKAITCDWYGQLLVEQQKYAEAKKCFEEAFDIFLKKYGETYSELVPLLNNLSVAALGLHDTKSAREYLKMALELVKKIPEATNEGLLQANLGLVYLRDGLAEQAKSTCSYAYRLGKKMQDDDSVEQANYCLDEIKKFTNDKKE